MARWILGPCGASKISISQLSINWEEGIGSYPFLILWDTIWPGLLFGYLNGSLIDKSASSLGIIHLFTHGDIKWAFLGWFRYGFLRLGLPKIICYYFAAFFLMLWLNDRLDASVLRSWFKFVGGLVLKNWIYGNNLASYCFSFYLIFLTVGGVLSCSCFLICVCLILRRCHLLKSQSGTSPRHWSWVLALQLALLSGPLTR